ncbi:type II toxin-antitoxin system HicA family toxin [Pricia mediterranea]|uniref:type II toxin-antitoxin system HicA family toxin n=1 Tax=Pricia mediterranea TaxID=3076079 RepID=UPI003D78A468
MFQTTATRSNIQSTWPPREPFTETFDESFEGAWFSLQTRKRLPPIYYNPTTKKTVVVPVHGNKDIKKGTFFAILKQEGIDK